MGSRVTARRSKVIAPRSKEFDHLSKVIGRLNRGFDRLNRVIGLDRGISLGRGTGRRSRVPGRRNRVPGRRNKAIGRLNNNSLHNSSDRLNSRGHLSSKVEGEDLKVVGVVAADDLHSSKAEEGGLRAVVAVAVGHRSSRAVAVGVKAEEDAASNRSCS